MIHLIADIGSVNHQRAGRARVFGGVQLLERLHSFCSEVTIDSILVEDADAKLQRLRIEVESIIGRVEAILSYITTPNFDLFKEKERLRYDLFNVLSERDAARRRVEELLFEQSKLLSMRERDREIMALKTELRAANDSLQRYRDELAKRDKEEFTAAMAGVRRRGKPT